MSCSLKFYDFVTQDLKILLLSLLCGTSHFVSSLLYLFFRSSLLTFLHVFHLSILLFILCVFHVFLVLFLIYPNKSLIVPKKLFYTIFHCTSAFPLSPSVASSVSSRVFCTICQTYTRTPPNPI
jgi:hypothetical protein